MDGKTLGKALYENIDYESLMETVEYFSTLSRQTGTDDGEAAADYIIKKLEQKGVSVYAHKTSCYASVPGPAKLEMTGPEEKSYYVYTDCFSAKAEEITGELYYDKISEKEKIWPKNQEHRYDSFKDKIILTWDLDEDFFFQAKLRGAKAVIRINFTEADEVMVYGVSKVWGVPTPETFMFTEVLPAVIIRKRDGEELIERLSKGERVEVSLTANVNNGIYEYTMPSVYIPGEESDNYVLVAAHYDGWFKSVTDNAIGAAMIIELAAAAGNMRKQLKRGIRFLWLAGHENVPYAGSTWFADTYFRDLRDHCVGYVNIDVIGNGVEGSRMFANTTRMEGNDFTDDIIEEITGERPEYYLNMVHAADQSFWGVQVPLDIMMNCRNPGWWYHTEADTLDKMDTALIRRDTKFYVFLISRIINAGQLPVDMSAFLGEVSGYMNRLKENLAPEFDIMPAIESLEKVKGKVKELEAAIEKHKNEDLDSVYMNIAGELSRICYSDSDGYNYSMTGGGMTTEPVGELLFAEGINSETAGSEALLCYRTKFIRFRNRFVGETDKLCKMIDLQLLQWSKYA